MFDLSIIHLRLVFLHKILKKEEKLSFVEKIVLAILKDQGKGSYNATQVYKQVPLESTITKDQIYQALHQLVNKKMADEPSKGHFRYIQPARLFEAYVEYTRKGELMLIPTDGSNNNEPYFINYPMETPILPGDKVLAGIEFKGKRSRIFIHEIVETGKKIITGLLDVFENKCYLIPDKANIPFDVLVQGDIKPEYDNQKAAVRLLGFDKAKRAPIGELLEVLGKSGSNDAEMHSIVLEFGFRTQFLEEVVEETAAIPNEISNESIKNRKDLRELDVFTIDPADAKDFDDAISLEYKDNDTYRIGVHIADVSHYVKEHTALDKEAINRATSVYLVDRTIPMLPEKLSNNLCSLRPNEDKLAFSALLTLDSNAKVLDVWLGKTIIHSKKRFSYEEAQEIIVGKQVDEKWFQILTDVNNLAKKRTALRKKNGALGFESAEIRFKLDEHGKPLELYKKHRFDAHKLIEEFMLLANQEVARFVYEKKKPPYPFIYRIHDQPQQERLIDLMTFCKLFGYKLDLSNETNIRRSLNQLLIDTEGKPEAHMIQGMAIRSMAKAIYTAERKDHFGLAFKYYSHFTSPIRRYPDLLAHRLLEDILEGRSNGYTNENIEKLAKHSSNMEQKAAEAERASTKYKMAEFLEDKKGKVFTAIVSGITDWGIYAEIEENYCEGLIRYSDIKWDMFNYIEKEKKAVGKRTKKTFKLGDEIVVSVKNANKSLRQIDFYLEK